MRNGFASVVFCFLHLDCHSRGFGRRQDLVLGPAASRSARRAQLAHAPGTQRCFTFDGPTPLNCCLPRGPRKSQGRSFFPGVSLRTLKTWSVSTRSKGLFVCLLVLSFPLSFGVPLGSFPFFSSPCEQWLCLQTKLEKVPPHLDRHEANRSRCQLWRIDRSPGQRVGEIPLVAHKNPNRWDARNDERLFWLGDSVPLLK